MTKRMLIDATHPEETRVVVLSGNRLEDFDFETSTKQQIKGNIYLAKVTRVEPSLQAAFVDYGGNRHGFLAFNEIHPDYYQIPIADREALAKEEAQAEARDMADEDAAAALTEEDDNGESAEPLEAVSTGEDSAAADDDGAGTLEEASDDATDDEAEEAGSGEPEAGEAAIGEPSKSAAGTKNRRVETVSGDEVEEIGRRRARPVRRYKIQEVIKRRQILLVQVVKEERGTKGAALTTYISLAGRFCVLMPNTARGGGISRKIVDPEDRKRLKSIAASLDVPEGMGVILRTAGMGRSKPEVRRDFNYLLKLWGEIRDRTLKSIAPTLIHEEANLIKRSIRDLYSKDIEEVQVDGQEGYRAAKEFMRTLMPSHAKRVIAYEDRIPLFYRYQVEGQLDAMHSPVVGLRSGGYIVINPTEALVAIDVNSGRATRERNIEETAYKTNLEAAEEVARQLRLRDLSGLIVIDFIDMEDNRNIRTVERRLKEAVKTDRARIQMGHISPFGLLEMSRQRLRPSLLEASTLICPHCNGAGHVRSTESTALHVLRAIEEEGIRERSNEVRVFVPTAIALYILNQKRDMLAAVEERYGFRIWLEQDDELIPPDFRLERVRARAEPEAAKEAKEAKEAEEAEVDRGAGKRRRRSKRRKEEAEEAAPAEAQDEAAAEAPEPVGEDDQEAPRKRRRRGKRGGRRRRGAAGEPQAPSVEAEAMQPEPEEAADAETAAEPAVEEPAKRPRRSRRRKADTARDEGEALAAPEETPAAGPGNDAKPKRTRRSRKKIADDEAATPEDGAASVSSSEAEPEASPKPPRRRAQKAEPSLYAPAPEGPAEVAKPEPSPPPVETPAAAPDSRPMAAREPGSEEAKEPRRGWWQKIVS